MVVPSDALAATWRKVWRVAQCRGGALHALPVGCAVAPSHVEADNLCRYTPPDVTSAHVGAYECSAKLTGAHLPQWYEEDLGLLWRASAPRVLNERIAQVDLTKAFVVGRSLHIIEARAMPKPALV